MNYLHGQILMSSLYALSWATLAITGVAKKRRIFHGTEGPEFTDDEKIEQAVATMKTHIDRVRDLCESLPSVGSPEERHQGWLDHKDKMGL